MAKRNKNINNKNLLIAGIIIAILFIFMSCQDATPKEIDPQDNDTDPDPFQTPAPAVPTYTCDYDNLLGKCQQGSCPTGYECQLWQSIATIADKCKCIDGQGIPHPDWIDEGEDSGAGEILCDEVVVSNIIADPSAYCQDHGSCSSGFICDGYYDMSRAQMPESNWKCACTDQLFCAYPCRVYCYGDCQLAPTQAVTPMGAGFYIDVNGCPGGIIAKSC